MLTFGSDLRKENQIYEICVDDSQQNIKLYKKCSWHLAHKRNDFSKCCIHCDWCKLISLSTVRDVQILFSEPAEATFQKSLQYMQTKGEWQLTDIIGRKSANTSYFSMNGLDSWDELVYNVCVTFHS